MNKELGKRGAQISDGYGPFKGKTFRIGHMGDLTLADVQWLTGQIDEILGVVSQLNDTRHSRLID